MKTKKNHEGYVLIDHRNSPGITQEFIRDNNLDAPAVGAGVVFESALMVCHHCGADVILNPNRSRERGWCYNCDRYICDTCTAARAAGAPCIPLKQKLEQLYETFILKQIFNQRETN